MRLQSETTVTVRGKEIGGADPLVCLPLVAGEKEELLRQAEAVKLLAPDLLEWRIDGFGTPEDTKACLDAQKALRDAVGETPLILTCRIHAEGGFKQISQQIRLKLITAAIAAGGIDIVDIEMCNKPRFIEAVRKAADAHGAKLILSYHNFAETPHEAFILDKLVHAQEMGGDIAKIAVMPNGYQDVLTLLGATLKARTGAVRIPIVAVSMGTQGAATRVVGGLFGSDITFAAGQQRSAPGQIPIGDLRKAMAILFP